MDVAPCFISQDLHGATSQKTELFMTTAVNTSNPAKFCTTAMLVLFTLEHQVQRSWHLIVRNSVTHRHTDVMHNYLTE
jgi:hypothetical protein